jgi:hypothetical protein
VNNQNHFTLSFPLKTPAEAAAITEQLTTLMPAMFQAEDTIGTVHYSRFTLLSDKTLLFLGDFDGEFGVLFSALAKNSGPVFDLIFQHVEDPPPTPVADHADEFVAWCADHLLDPVNLYTAYPGATVKRIKALAAAADVHGDGVLNPFLVILPIKSKLAFAEIKLLLRARGSGTTKDLDKVGTPHFAQFVPLEDEQVGFFTVYDGTFDTYIADFTKNIGQVFDLIFKFCINPPPSPCRKYLQEFIDFAAGANRKPIGFYQAYGPNYDHAQPYDGIKRGLLGYFINSSFENQYELVLGHWVNDAEFAGAVRLNPKAKDPMIGTQDPATSIFVIPQANGAPPIKLTGFSSFTTTKAAAYCFLPSITAMKFIAQLG